MSKYSTIQITNKQKKWLKTFGKQTDSYADILEDLMEREDFRIELIKMNDKIDKIMERLE